MNREYVVVVKFAIYAQAKDKFIERVMQQAQDSLALEAGCLVFDVCLSGESANEVLLYEVYRCAKDFDTHLASKHFKAFDKEVAAWVESKVVSSYGRLLEAD